MAIATAFLQGSSGTAVYSHRSRKPQPRSDAMKIGVPKEIKVHEYRVGLVPAGVHELVESGHQVLVQGGAGAGIGFGDSDYQAAGAKIAAQAADVFGASELIVKVKEPQLAECKM